MAKVRKAGGKAKGVPRMEKLVDAYYKGAEGEFVFDDVLEKVGGALKIREEKARTRLAEDILDYLFDEYPFPELVERKEDKDGTQFFIKPWDYFEGGKFCVKPLSFEIEHRILFPGHRFLPFHDPDLMPYQLRVHCSGSKTPLPMKELKLKVSEVLVYYSMFGSDAAGLMAPEESGNLDVIDAGEEDPVVTVSVIDMSELYPHLAFSSGDCLVMTCVDWSNGTFMVSHLPEAERLDKFSEIKEWTERLAAGCESSFQVSGPNVSIEQQLAEAFYSGGRFLLENPYVHVGGFLAQNQTVDLVCQPEFTILWRKGEDPAALIEYISDGEDDGADIDAEPGSMQWFLSFLGFDLSETDVDAFLLDELHSGRGDLGNALARCFGDKLPLIDAEPSGFGGKLLDAISEHWARLKGGYNRFADNERGKLRSELLTIKEKQLRFIRFLEDRGVGPESLPKVKINAFVHITRLLDDMLRLIEVEDITKDDVEKAMSSVELSAAIIEQLTLELGEQLD